LNLAGIAHQLHIAVHAGIVSNRPHGKIGVSPGIVGDQLVITNSISGTNTFYRLRDGN